MKYRKKPVVIEAIKYTGYNYEEVRNFTGKDKVIISIEPRYVTIETIEGSMKANPDDFIIRGVKGEFYPCKPDIFEMTYEKIEP